MEAIEMCIERGADKEGEVHLYKGILINLKKKRIWVTWAEVDEPAACYVEWNKSKGENKILYINVYIWNLEKWHWLTYFQGRKKDTDRENVCGHNRERRGQVELRE